MIYADRAVAEIADEEIVGERSEPRERRVPGLAKGIFSIVAKDDDHLKDFAEYMP